MKYLKKFNFINESFTPDDLDDILQDIRDYGLKVTVKEGWVEKDKINTTDIEFNYVNTVPYQNSLKTYFINIWGYLDHEDLSHIFSDIQELKDRCEDIGSVKSIYEIETHPDDDKKIVFRSDFRLISNSHEYNENFLDEYKNILHKHGYKTKDASNPDWRKNSFEVILPSVNIPKLTKPKKEMSKEEKEERMKLIKKLKYDPWNKMRTEIKNILAPIADKNNMEIHIYHREAFEKMDVVISAKYVREEEE